MTDDERYQMNTLLFIGGALLAGKVLFELFPGDEKKVETTREPRLSEGTQRTSKTILPYQWVGEKEKLLIKQIARQEYVNQNQTTEKRRFVVEVPREPAKTKNPSGTSTSLTSSGEERKYPPNYYTLSKSNQYKYRQRMAKDLIQISQEHIK